MKRLLQSMLCLILCPLLVAQQVAPPASKSMSQLPLPPPTANSPTRTVIIPMDTLVVLRLEQRLSTADAKQGDKVHFTLVNDLAAGGRVVIPAGTSYYLTIDKVWRATPKDPDIIGGIAFTAPELDLGHGQKVRLTGTTYAERHENYDGISGPRAILMLIAIPFFLPSILHQQAKAKRANAKQAVVTPKNWKPCDREYEVGYRLNYYFRRAVKIHADRLATSNASTQLQ
ncbi:MAG TPA: hypothetical protein VKF63_07935 [Terracidiphilus sp.]|nr:hypothetical protein [Terracidiphilus sp.]